MKKMTKTLWVFLLMLGCLLGTGHVLAATPIQPKGTGTEENPYEISTVDELFWFAGLVNGTLTDGTVQNVAASAVLMNDITLNENVLTEQGELNGSGDQFRSWTPMGSNDKNVYYYSGTFEGNGHTIYGLYINNDQVYKGFFAVIGNGGRIQNLTLSDSYIHGGNYVGSICAHNASGHIINCCNMGTVVGNNTVGGICGYTCREIDGCYNSGSVCGNTCVGGISGGNQGILTDCYNSGPVIGGTSVGGVCGLSCFVGGEDTWIIQNCYNRGQVSGNSNVGGVCGKIDDSSSNVHSMTRCFWMEGTADQGIGSGSGSAVSKSEEEFASGEVAWLLNDSGSEGAWRQNLDNDQEVDAYPVLDDTHGIVYSKAGATCDGTLKGECTNDELASVPSDQHQWTPDGFCSVCDQEQPAVWNEDAEQYEISNAGQLYWFAGFVRREKTRVKYNPSPSSANAMLLENIILNKNVLDESGQLNGDGSNFRPWSLIGLRSISYTGVFDGAGHTITGLYINAPSSSWLGLVAELGDGGIIRNLGLEDSFVSGDLYVGGVCGMNNKGSIINCYNSGSVSGTIGVGSMCGSNSGKIDACYNNGIISCNSYAGSVCGQNLGSITNCYWLEGTANQGIGSGSGSATVKSADQFKSGEVAVLLQGVQTELAWGQTIGTDEYPVLITDEAKKVYAYSIYKGSDAAEAGYANSGASISLEGNAVAVVEAAGFTAADGNANVIVKDGEAYTCANLVLTDGADFYTPVAFTADEATYSRTLPETSTWGTIVLPFSAETIEGADLYEATEIVADGSEESILTVQPLTGGALEAHTPALFQGETAGTTLTFSASDAEVAATADAVLTKAIGENGYTLTGSLSTIDALTEGDLFIAKDMFWSVGTQNTVRMQAFRAYIDAPEAGPAQVNVLRILIGDATSIRQTLSDGTLPVDVYSLQGVQLRKNVECGEALEGLPAGIYIVGGKKVVKK